MQSKLIVDTLIAIWRRVMTIIDLLSSDRHQEKLSGKTR